MSVVRVSSERKQKQNKGTDHDNLNIDSTNLRRKLEIFVLVMFDQMFMTAQKP